MSINNRMKSTFIIFILLFPIVLSASEIESLRHCVQVFDYPKTHFEQLPGAIDSYEICISKTSTNIAVKDHTVYQKGTALPINSIIRFTDGTILNLNISKGSEDVCKFTMPIYISRTKNGATGIGCLVLDYGYKKSILNVYVKYFIPAKNSLTNISSLLKTTISVKSLRCKDGEAVCNNLIPFYESTVPKESQMH
jgi:hypothetical protein